MNGAGKHRLKRFLLVAAEAALVLAIIGLMVAIWLPALIGANPGAVR